MKPKSITSPSTLRCAFCMDQRECRANGMMGHSTWERTAMASLCTHLPYQAGSYDLVISETCLWARADTTQQLRKCRLDFLICTKAQAKERDFRNAVCLFIDGQHHFDWLQEEKGEKWSEETRWPKQGEQYEADCDITAAAVALGYCVVRVCFKDAGDFLSIVRAAWERRHQAVGFVSARWSLGAHRPLRFHCGGARHLLDRKATQQGVDSRQELDLVALTHHE